MRRLLRNMRSTRAPPAPNHRIRADFFGGNAAEIQLGGLDDVHEDMPYSSAHGSPYQRAPRRLILGGRLHVRVFGGARGDGGSDTCGRWGLGRGRRGRLCGKVDGSIGAIDQGFEFQVVALPPKACKRKNSRKHQSEHWTEGSRSAWACS